MTNLVQYERARTALAAANRVDEVMPLLDEFALAKTVARQIKDQALLADATEYQLRAERRLGQILAAAKDAGLFRQGRQGKGVKPDTFSRPTLEDAGIDRHLSARARRRSEMADDLFEAMLQQTRERIASGAAKTVNPEPVNGHRSIMSSRQEPDHSLDYFPTPPWATRALIERAFPQASLSMPTSVWEPACGEGHMAEVLTDYAATVIASDIFDYGYGDVLDFFNVTDPPGVDWIITNPPFEKKAEAFVLRALELAPVGVAMLVRLQWLEGVGRYKRTL